MTIPFLLLWRLMAGKFIDDPLIDVSRRKTGDEAMSQSMETSQHLPFPARQRPLEVVMAFVPCHGHPPRGTNRSRRDPVVRQPDIR